jgi:hypothetical protein
VTYDQEKQRTAVHEAAHVVAGHLLGRGVDAVTIKPTEELLGLTVFDGTIRRPAIPDERGPAYPVTGLSADARRIVESRMLIAMAGHCATDAYFGPRVVEWRDSDTDRPYMSDQTQSFEAAFEAHPECATAHQDYMHAIARRMVRHPKFKALLRDLATELLERETLTGREVRTILRRAETTYDERTTDEQH